MQLNPDGEMMATHWKSVHWDLSLPLIKLVAF